MIAAWAKDYIGLPYKELGRDREGVDCYGVPYLVLRDEFGEQIPSYATDYSDSFDKEEVAALVSGEIISRWVMQKTPEIGDVILFRIFGRPCHVGVVVGDGYFIHAWNQATGVILENYMSALWSRRVIGFYKYAGC